MWSDTASGARARDTTQPFCLRSKSNHPSPESKWLQGRLWRFLSWEDVFVFIQSWDSDIPILWFLYKSKRKLHLRVLLVNFKFAECGHFDLFKIYVTEISKLEWKSNTRHNSLVNPGVCMWPSGGLSFCSNWLCFQCLFRFFSVWFSTRSSLSDSLLWPWSTKAYVKDSIIETREIQRMISLKRS